MPNQDSTRRCRQCGETKPTTEFYRRSRSPHDFKATCKACRNASQRAAIKAINARTVCAHCGAQPIEWHNPEHVDLGRQDFRIGDMVHRGCPLDEILAEMARCTPLCRRCHMTEDGRLRTLLAGIAERVALTGCPGRLPTNQPCSACGREYRPLRKGLCDRCNDRRRYHALTPEQRARRVEQARRKRQHD